MKTVKDRNGNTWTHSQFLGFIRSMLRRGSFRWLPRKKALEASRRPSESTNARLKWEFVCAACHQWWPQKMVMVDHVIPCGSLDNLNLFVERLYPEDPNAFQVLCKDCHQKKTNHERKIKYESKTKKTREAALGAIRKTDATHGGAN